jgi:hypothetical protein
MAGTARRAEGEANKVAGSAKRAVGKATKEIGVFKRRDPYRRPGALSRTLLARSSGRFVPRARASS